MSLLKGSNEILTHVEKRYALPVLLVNFAKRESRRLNGLFTLDSLRVLLNGKNYYAADVVFSFFVLCIDRTVGFETSSDLTEMLL